MAPTATNHLEETHEPRERRHVYVTGGKSDPIENEPIVAGLEKVFHDLIREIYKGYHFDPPHRAEPERFAISLKRLWVRAAASA